MGLVNRRDILQGAGALAIPGADGGQRIGVDLVLAPSNLGLRPNENNTEPGTWRAPEVLMAAGLSQQRGVRDVVALKRPAYVFDAQPGTRIRNGLTIRNFSLALGGLVRASIAGGQFPVVVGGDCSVLLGALYGARLAGGRGLAHIDGHSDFFHPGNYDYRRALGAAAGMDLALVTGRGEPLLTQWPNVEGPLVHDADAFQIGERDALDPDFARFYGDIVRTDITRLIVQDLLAMDAESAAAITVERMNVRALNRAWMHMDLDVLDRAVMPAVDSPGSPGLDFAQLAAFAGALLASGRFVGMTVAIYDPERDPAHVFAPHIVRMLNEILSRIPARR